MHGDVSHFPFSEAKLLEDFGSSATVFYLRDYLRHLRAGTVLREEHYVDRHFLDDFTEYYARSFNAPTPSCSRYHFFSDLTDDELERLLEDVYSDASRVQEVEGKLQEKYLGFVVRRPIGHAPLGRTVLKTYEADGRRHYTVVRPYRVHVAGLCLSIQGLAFQQQDGGAAVCASTSLWSALQRVAYVAGHRTPTPSAITRAAQSPFPASNGLALPQMAAALATMGYVADVFAPSTNRAVFRAKLVSCLDSHLPVILLISREVDAGTNSGRIRQGHAVTVTGYSEPQHIIELAAPLSKAPPIRMKTASVEVLYVHDDNIGSHAHYELLDSTTRNDLDQPELVLRRGRTGQVPVDWWDVDDWIVEAALVPKPSKLRMSVDDVVRQVWLLRQLTEQIFPGIQLYYSTRFCTGTSYKRELLEAKNLDPMRMRDFQSVTTFPRHIGVVGVHDSVGLLCEFVLDVSEIERRPLLALVGQGVPLHSPAWVNLQQVASVYRLPLITAKPTV